MKKTFLFIIIFVLTVILYSNPKINVVEYPFMLKQTTSNLSSFALQYTPQPIATDLNNDGIIDLLVGNYYGKLIYLKQDGMGSNNFIMVSNNFCGIDVGDDASPCILDIDGDNKLDLLITNQTHNVYRYEQDSLNSLNFVLRSSDYITLSSNANHIAAADLDGDSKLDLLIGLTNGTIDRYEQSSHNSLNFDLRTHNFNSIDLGSEIFPEIIDFDFDGKLDLFIGSFYTFYRYEQDDVESLSFDIRSKNFSHLNTTYHYYYPAFTDLNNDGYWDLILPKSSIKLTLYKQDKYNIDFKTILKSKNYKKNFYCYVINPEDDLDITTSSNVKIATSLNGTYQNSLTINRVNGKISKLLYCKFYGSLEQNYERQIFLNSNNANPDTVLVTASPIDATFPYAHKGYYLNSSNTLLKSKDEKDLDFENFSLDFWFYPFAPNNYYLNQEIIQKMDDSNGFSLSISYSNSFDRCNLNFIIKINGNNYSLSPTFSTYHWVHIVATYDGEKMKLYVNDNKVGERTVNETFQSNNEFLTLGESSNSNPFPLVIDELRIWDKALTLSEIRKYKNLILTGYEPNLIFYEQFENYDANILYDLGGAHWLEASDNMSDNLYDSYFVTGKGESDIQTVSSTGSYSFCDPKIIMDFTQKTGTDTFVVTRIDTIAPNGESSYNAHSHNRYWIIKKYGNGSFNSDISFQMPENISNYQYEDFQLLRRSTDSYTYANWALYKNSSKIIIPRDSLIIFKDINSDGQYMIERKLPTQQIIYFQYPFSFLLENEEFAEFNLGNDAKPCFFDFDNDGLIELFIGRANGKISYYKQNENNASQFDFITNQFGNIDVGSNAAPCFYDIDGDGKYDLLIGNSDGKIYRYEADDYLSDNYVLRTDNFCGIDVGSNATPFLIDIDNDKKVDLLIGESAGNINRYEQSEIYGLDFSLITDSFNSIDIGSNSVPFLVDFDYDGYLDLLVGKANGRISHYIQSDSNPRSFILVDENFGSIDVGSNSAPFMINLSNLIYNLYVGYDDGKISYYRLLALPEHITIGKIQDSKSYTYKALLSAVRLYDSLLINSYNNLLFKTDVQSDTLWHSSYQIDPEDNDYIKTVLDIKVDYDVNENGDISFEDGNQVKYSEDYYYEYSLSNQTSSSPGYALNLTSQNDRIYVNDSDALDITDEITLEAWIKASSWGDITEGNIISKKGNYSGYALRCGDNGKLNFLLGINGAWEQLTSDEIMQLNQWQYIAATFKDSTMKIYINGDLVGEQQTSGNISANNQLLMIGSSPKHRNKTFMGNIDEIKIYNIAKSAEEIRRSINLPVSVDENGLVAYWQFISNNGSTILSDIIGGNYGTFEFSDINNSRINSTIPFGSGYFDYIDVSGNLHPNFNDAGVSMSINILAYDFTFYIAVTKIESAPNVLPTDAAEVFSSQYWTIKQYDPGSYYCDIKFYPSEQFLPKDIQNHSNICLYKRDFNSDGAWTLFDTAYEVTTNYAKFRNFSEPSGQYIIARKYSYSPPSNVTITPQSDNILLSWDKVEEASSYKVYSCNEPDGEYQDVTSQGSFEENGNRVTWTTTNNNLTKNFFKIKIVYNPSIKSEKK